MNKNELKAHMARHGDNNTKLAEVLGKAPSTVSYKLNGSQQFSLSEVQIIIDRYHLTPEEVQTIFFTPQVAEYETNESESC